MTHGASLTVRRSPPEVSNASAGSAIESCEKEPRNTDTTHSPGQPLRRAGRISAEASYNARDLGLAQWVVLPIHGHARPHIPHFLENQTVFGKTCSKHPENPWQSSRETYAPPPESRPPGRFPVFPAPPVPPVFAIPARRRSNRQPLIARSTQSPPAALKPSIPQPNPRRHE